MYMTGVENRGAEFIGEAHMPGPSRKSRRAPRPPASPAAALNDSEYRALADFRHALREFLAFSEAAASASGVTTQQYQALLVIKANPEQSVLVREMAEEMLLKHNNAVQLADRLADAKLIRREASKTDKRAVLLRLTAKGEAKIAYLAAIHFRELVKRSKQFVDISRMVTRLEYM